MRVFRINSDLKAKVGVVAPVVPIRWSAYILQKVIWIQEPALLAVDVG